MGLKHLVKRWIPEPLLPPLRRCRNYLRSGATGAPTYDARLQSEIDRYTTIQAVHELPAIAHYWSNRYLVPILQPFGFTNSIELFRTYMTSCCRKQPTEQQSFLSIGAGDSASEE